MIMEPNENVDQVELKTEEKVEQSELAKAEENIELKTDEKVELIKAEEIVAVEESVEKVEKVGGIDKSAWKPRTALGRRVQNEELTDIDAVLSQGLPILESEIADILIPDMEVDLLLIGQSKGKFGGGKRRAFRSTQKKTKEGNKPKFDTYAAIGNRNGVLGLGYGKAKETVPAREKAVRNAKINLIKIRRGCGSWQCNCKTPHSIPFKVEGKCGSVRVVLMPAPKGTGLACEEEVRKMLRFAGVKDVWSKTFGKTESRVNLVNAAFNALKKTMSTKLMPDQAAALGITEDR